MWSELAGAFFFIGYVGYTTSTLLSASSPPICEVKSSDDCLRNAIPEFTPYATHLYISKAPPTQIGLNLSNLTNQLTIAPKNPNVHIGTVESVVGYENDCDVNSIQGNGAITPVKKKWYQRFSPKSVQECEARIFFDVPGGWHNNRTSLYLTTISTESSSAEEGYTRMTFSPAVRPISLHYQPEKKDLAKKRYLLEDFHQADLSSKEVKGESYIAVPRLIRFGPIKAYEDFNRTRLLQLGRSNWLRADQPDQYFPENQIDTYVSPRDEYLPLANVAEDLLRKRSLLVKDGGDNGERRLPTRMTFVLKTIGWRKNAIEKLMMQGVATMEAKFGTDQYESDSLKLLFAGNSPEILILTLSVSVLHMVFEFLAMMSNWANFKEHCQDQDKAKAVSARAILLDTVFETLILLWLFDEGHARIVQLLLLTKIVYNSYRYYKLSQVQQTKSEEVDLAENSKSFRQVSVWRMLKDMGPFDAIRPSKLTQRRKQLNSSDFELWALLSHSTVLAVIFAGWAVYQVVYVPQKSWLSAMLKLGAHLAYGGGFIAMTPQLYKNYYHRTVAHLPWVALTYNFLNTIIDDLFSFLIRMPKEHRISVFRDDIIFVIYWIQKWHYKREQQKIAEAKKKDDGASKEIESVPTQGKTQKLRQ